jgi:membrane protein
VSEGRTTQTRVARLGKLTRLLAGEFRRRDLLTYASAIAFRGLVALVPLTLLGLGLLGALGLQDVWRETVAPALEGRLTTPVYEGIDHSVERILSSGTAGLIAFAAALLLWELIWAVGAVTSALNRIHDVEERRSARRRLLVRVWLAAAVGVCLIGAALAVLAAPKLGEGALDVVIGIGRWVVSVTLLGLAVGLLFRYAPAERPQAKWASAGSVLVIASWIVASLLFRLYVTSVADFETAIGSLAVFLVLTAYVFTSATIFIVGAQLDELLRKDAEEGESVGVFQLLRAAFGRSG